MDTSSYLKDLRRQRRLSQADAARLTDGTARQVDRLFVAGLESRGIPRTAQKLLSYAYAIGADLRVLHELEILAASVEEPDGRLTYPEAREIAMGACRAGEFGRATRAVLLALSNAAEEKDAGCEASCLLLLAAVMKEAGRWNAAREFAERALVTRALRPNDTARGLILVAAAHDELGLPELSEAVLSLVDEELFGRDRELGALTWFSRGVARRHMGLQAASLEAFVRAEEHLSAKAPPAIRARLLAHRAQILSSQGEIAAAIDLVDEAEQLSTHADVESRANVLLLAGEACRASGRLARAEFLLTRSIDLAARHDLRVILQEARVELAKLQLKRRNISHFRSLLRSLEAALRAGHYRHSLIQAVDELKQALNEGGGND